ncbi:hypothetical protein F4824DRAFT_96901 [Ustulina deusta]|nr:hypothetical protein F4824DRAFT_96901 [Ustulina deusta]
MATWIHISTYGTIYFASCRSAIDDDMIQLYSRVLLGKTVESTFDVVYSNIAREWYQQEDIVNPFYNSRRNHIETCWIFDLDNDVLRLNKENRHLQLPLSLIRARSVTITDFESYAPPRLSEPGSRPFLASPYWNLRRKGLDPERLGRRRAFVGRVLNDFAFQWRHILCGRYNNSTFRKFACAIIRIATLDFNVVEATTSRQGSGGFLVWLHNLPEWDPLKGDVVPVSRISIVVSRHITHAIAIARKHFAKTTPSAPSQIASTLSDKYQTYLILTVREVILYRIKNDSEIYTKPERLFDGYEPPSEEALQLLLEATYGRFTGTLTHRLPIELQDRILDNVSAGPIERARVGCILECGSIFAWKCGGRNIEREEGCRNRTQSTPVESHIWFGDHPSGVAYK